MSELVRWRRARRWVALACACVLLTACSGSGRSAKPTPTLPAGVIAATPAGRSTPPPAASPAATPGTAELGAVVWATAIDPTTMAPATPVPAFAATAPTIYAVLPVTMVEPGARISVIWSIGTTPIPGVDGVVVADRAAQQIWVEFHLTRTTDAPWPAGTYRVTVAVNGQEVQTATVTVSGG